MAGKKLDDELKSPKTTTAYSFLGFIVGAILMTAIAGKLEAFGADFSRMPSTFFMVAGIYFAFSLLYCSVRQIGFTRLTPDNEAIIAMKKIDELDNVVERIGFKLPDKVILFSFLMMTVMFTIIIYLLPSGSR